MTAPRIRWVAPAGPSSTLSEVLEKLGSTSTALTEGVVFVNRKRVTDAQRVISPFDSVEVFPNVAASGRCSVVARRGDLLIVDKPPALASEPTQHGLQSVAVQLREQLGTQVHIASRLDVGVGGLVLASTSPEGHRHIARLREAGKLRREYLALAGGRLAAAHGFWRSTQPKGRRQVHSETRYTVLAATGADSGPQLATLLWLEPITGRTHQLRRHAADASAPLLGDRRYSGQPRVILPNGLVREIRRVMLHAVRLTLRDQQGSDWQVEAPPPLELLDLWRDLAPAQDLAHPAVSGGAAALYRAALDGKPV